MHRSLEGVRVIEFTSFTAGPLGGAYLAQLGAEVIKIESLEGDAVRRLGYPVNGASYLFHINNNSKHSATINIKKEEGRRRVLELVEQADVLLENVAPGSLARQGLSFEELSRINSRLIYCSMSGYGYTGPRAGLRAYDVVVQGLTGLISVTGHDGKAVKVGPSVTDLLAAASSAAAIGMALLHQRNTGEGQYIDMSLYDVGAWLAQEAWAGMVTTDETAKPIGNRDRNTGPQNTYASRDGRLVAIAVETDPQWRALCAVINRADLAEDPALQSPKARAASDVADRAIARWVSGLDGQGAVDRCQSVGVPAILFMELPEIAGHPHIAQRNMIVRVGEGENSFLLPASPFRLTATPSLIDGPAEALGASNDYVFRTLLGYSDEEIARMRREGILK